jgi:hypothetical protein
MTGCGPIATEIHVSCHVGNQDKSGLVVLNVSFVARDPIRNYTNWRAVIAFDLRKQLAEQPVGVI